MYLFNFSLILFTFSSTFMMIILIMGLYSLSLSLFLIQQICLLSQNKDVSDAIQKVAAAYDCKIVEGVLSHQLKQFVIDGNKAILSVSNPDTRVDDAEFEENEVYSIDIVTSTGEGKVSCAIITACVTYCSTCSLTLIGFSCKYIVSHETIFYWILKRIIFTLGTPENFLLWLKSLYADWFLLCFIFLTNFNWIINAW